MESEPKSGILGKVTYALMRIVRWDAAEHTALRFGGSSSNNWSGFELSATAGTFDWVSGMWHVPSVFGESNTITFSSYWVGLDGDGITDLVQAGTEQENLTLKFFGVQWSISYYYAWTQFLPQQQTERQVANFPIHAGDEIFVQVWIGDTGSLPTLKGAYGVFLLMNETTSEHTYIFTPVGMTKVSGSEAEWIMERPTVAGNPPDLADYNSAVMSSAVARTERGVYSPYEGANNVQITMVNGSDTLSTVTPIDTLSMRFDWHAFH